MMSLNLESAHNATAFGAADASSSDCVRERDVKCTTRTLSILQLNINGTQKKRDELQALLEENDIHIACLQETKLNKNLQFSIKNYNILRKDRIDRIGGGLALLIRKDVVKYREIKIDQAGSTELQAIKVLLPGRSFILINVYHPDNSNIDTETLCNISHAHSDFIVMLGDFNAKSPTWGSHSLDDKGKQVENLLIDLNLVTLNNRQNTYLSRTTGTQSALDLTAVSYHINNYCTWKIIDNAMSDHRPIITKCNFNIEIPAQVKKSWNFRKADWLGFTQHLDSLCESTVFPDTLEEQLRGFTQNINTTAKIFIPRGKRKQNWIPYWKDQNIDSLIKERDLLNEQLKTHNTEENRRLLSEASTRVEERIAANKQQKWAEFCKTLDPGKDAKYWKITKSLKNSFTPVAAQSSNILGAAKATVDSNEKVANKLALYYSSVSKIDYQKEDKKIKSSARKLLLDARGHKHDDLFLKDITIEELNIAINSIKGNKSPGNDLIFGEMVKHFGGKARQCLLTILNTSWKSGRLPEAWKTSIIVPILKSNKSATECKNYRPIALTSILCKVMERIVHSRIMEFLLENKTINFYQTAYRKHHSTEDQLFYFCQSVIDGFQERLPKKTIAIFLDMSSAFDRVWRQKLITLVHHYGIRGNALIWINDFLRNRKVRVRYNGCLSKSKKIFAGVPQGSVLSPLLFLLYVNNIHPNLNKDTRVACYADDIAIWHSGRDIHNSETVLQNSLNGIVKWTQSLKLKINAEKTTVCVFSTDRKHRKLMDPKLYIEGKPIMKSSCPKYLGIVLDAELRFTEHVKTCADRALKKLRIIKSLCGTDWGASPRTLRTTYTSLIRPVMEYASSIWAHASKTVLERLESVQARAAKIITGAVSSTNNLKVIRECGLESLEKRRKYNVIKFTNKARSRVPEHIARKTFENYNSNTRLKRSSPVHFDKETRVTLGLEHNNFSIYQEPLSPSGLPMNTKIVINLLEPCNKKELTDVIKAKGLRTIEQYPREVFVHAYTDGSSDETITNGGSGVFMLTPSDATYERKLGAGAYASNFTCELLAIVEALDMYKSLPVPEQAEGLVIFCDSKAALQAILNGGSSITSRICSRLNEVHMLNKICTLQWLPAHVNITGNENADKLAKEARNLNSKNNVNVTLFDANAVAKFKLKEQSIPIKHQLCNINRDRLITKTIVRLRTGHYRGMKIDEEGRKIYRNCDNCPSTTLTTAHIFDCPAILADLLKIGVLGSKMDLYDDNIVQIARAVISAHGII